VGGKLTSDLTQTHAPQIGNAVGSELTSHLTCDTNSRSSDRQCRGLVGAGAGKECYEHVILRRCHASPRCRPSQLRIQLARCRLVPYPYVPRSAVVIPSLLCAHHLPSIFLLAANRFQSRRTLPTENCRGELTRFRLNQNTLTEARYDTIGFDFLRKNLRKERQ
jgi:hypothetical protein